MSEREVKRATAYLRWWLIGVSAVIVVGLSLMYYEQRTTVAELHLLVIEARQAAIHAEELAQTNRDLVEDLIEARQSEEAVEFNRRLQGAVDRIEALFEIVCTESEHPVCEVETEP